MSEAKWVSLFIATITVFILLALLLPKCSPPGTAEIRQRRAGHSAGSGGQGGRCTGSDYCTACTNCSRCQHCRAGGSCGVCRHR